MTDGGPKDSVATTSLGAVSQELKSMQGVVLRVNPSVQEIATTLVKLDGYFGEASTFLGVIEQACRLLRSALDLCRWVGQLIPEVGPVIARIATWIERSRIEQTIRETAQGIDRAIKDARDGILKGAKQTTNLVAGKLEGLKDAFPGWEGAVGMAQNLSSMIDQVTFVAQGNTKDDLLGPAVKELQDKFALIQAASSQVKNALDPIGSFIEHSWNEIRNDILRPIQNGISDVMQAVSSAMATISSCCRVCDTIKEWFEPFFWVLDACNWLFEHTVGWLIDKVMHELGLDELVRYFQNTIAEKLNITSIGKTIEDLASKPLRQIKTTLNDAVAGSIEEKVQQMTSSLVEFQKGPGAAMLDAFRKSPLLSDLLNGKGPVWNQVSPDPDDESSSDRSERDEVKEAQAAMDALIESFGPRADKPADESKPVQPPRPVKLCYATLNEEFVSIRMRTTQTRVLAQQAPLLDAHLPPLDTMPESPSGDDAPSKEKQNQDQDTLSGGAAPSFDSFVAKSNELLRKMDRACDHIGRVGTAAKQADAAFKSFSPGALSFCDELVALLEGVDPIYDAITGAISVPLKRRQAITDMVGGWLGSDQPSPVFKEVIDVLFGTLARTQTVVEEFKTRKNAKRAEAQEISNKYQACCGHVSRACSPSLFPPTLGPHLVDLASLIEALRRRIQSTGMTLRVLKRAGSSFFQNQPALRDDEQRKKVAAELDAIYLALNSVVDAASQDMDRLPARVDAVHASLSKVYDGVRAFFGASAVLSRQCRVVEAKLIAADQVRGHCQRVCAVIGPFEALLDKMGAPKDAAPLSPSKPSDQSEAAAIKTLVKLVLKGAVTAGLHSLLDRYLGVDDLALTVPLPTAFDQDVTAYEAALQALVKSVEPTQTNLFAMRSKTGPPLRLANPLLDDASASAFSTLVQRVYEAVGRPDDKSPRQQAWTMPPRDVLQVQSVYLAEWGRKWDAVETSLPSTVFIRWYQLLQELDQLVVDTRQGWQRVDIKEPVAAPPPSAMAEPALALWKDLEVKATAGGTLYRSTIAPALSQPLHDRITQLLQGQIQLATGGAGTVDILKDLPAPASSPASPTAPWVLPDIAANAMASAMAVKDVPRPLSELLARQAQFESLRVNLKPYLDALSKKRAEAKKSPDVGGEALVGLHHDFNFMDARRHLELSLDVNKVNEWLQKV